MEQRQRLTHITLPKSLKCISESAFANCIHLKEIRISAETEVVPFERMKVSEDGRCTVATGKGQVILFGDPFLAEKQQDNPFKGCSGAKVVRY